MTIAIYCHGYILLLQWRPLANESERDPDIHLLTRWPWHLTVWPQIKWWPGLFMYYPPAKFGDDMSRGFCFRLLDCWRRDTYIHTYRVAKRSADVGDYGAVSNDTRTCAWQPCRQYGAVPVVWFRIYIFIRRELRQQFRYKCRNTKETLTNSYSCIHSHKKYWQSSTSIVTV